MSDARTMINEAREKALSAEAIRSQLDEVDAFVFIGVDGSNGLRVVTATAHGNPDVLTECLAEVLADLRGGIARPH